MSALQNINDQIAAARSAAAAGATTSAEAAPPAVGSYQAPATAPVAAGRPVTLGELFAQGGMSVDKYLKIDKTGILLGTDLKNPQEELEVEFKISDITPFWGLRFGENPVKYLRSIDRMVESRSKKPWSQCVAEAQQVDSRCRGDYPSADVPFTLISEDIIAEKGERGAVLVKQGQTVGLTLSVTNFKEFKAFMKPYDDLVANGTLPADQILRGKLVHKTAEGGGQTYGKVDFVDFILVEESALDAAQAAAEQG